ncbi:MAG: hypothetical protein AB1521_03185 [Bacteroidota bacterium]
MAKMDESIKRIEFVFRNSVSQDELFDAFREAIVLRINDVALYKILLANPALNKDEIKMYTEKLLKEIPGSTFQLCMWTAKVFENHAEDYEQLEHAIVYYTKACYHNPESHEPYLDLVKLYNTDMELPSNKKILQIIETGTSSVIYKSKVYFALSDLFKKMNDLNNASKYLALAAKAAEREKE